MGITTISTEEYAEGVRATAILGAVCDMLRDGTGYASDGICSILGIKREKCHESDGRYAGSQDPTTAASN